MTGILVLIRILVLLLLVLLLILLILLLLPVTLLGIVQAASSCHVSHTPYQPILSTHHINSPY